MLVMDYLQAKEPSRKIHLWDCTQEERSKTKNWTNIIQKQIWHHMRYVKAVEKTHIVLMQITALIRHLDMPTT